MSTLQYKLDLQRFMKIINCIPLFIPILTSVNMSLRNCWKSKLPGIGEINMNKEINS